MNNNNKKKNGHGFPSRNMRSCKISLFEEEKTLFPASSESVSPGINQSASLFLCIEISGE
jgi:hypothetical protein